MGQSTQEETNSSRETERQASDDRQKDARREDEEHVYVNAKELERPAVGTDALHKGGRPRDGSGGKPLKDPRHTEGKNQKVVSSEEPGGISEHSIREASGDKPAGN